MKLFYCISVIALALFYTIITPTKQSLIKSSSIACVSKSDTIITILNDAVSERNFILFGIVNHQTIEMLKFKKKYGVGFKFETCVVDPMSYKITSQKNKKTAIYLTEKFENTWLNELPVLPFGINK